MHDDFLSKLWNCVEGGKSAFFFRHFLQADSLNNVIRRLDLASGAVTTVAGTITFGYTDGVGTEAKFYNPWSVALDAAGTFALIADYANHAIRRIDLTSGVVTTLAGNFPRTLGHADGVGLAASFYYPTGVALDANGSFAIIVRESVRVVEMRRIGCRSSHTRALYACVSIKYEAGAID